MEIILENIGKKFNRQWIFNGVNLHLSAENNYVILGGNGSGKSTLLQIIAGYLTPSTGELAFKVNDNAINPEHQYKHVAMATPYLNLYEELNLIESIELQQKFNPFQNNFSNKEVMEILELEKSKNKQLKFYSSGMKQRVKLGLAILSQAPALLLDEPISNLDVNATNWYINLIDNYAKNKLIVVASNNTQAEFGFCNEQILVEKFKG